VLGHDQRPVHLSAWNFREGNDAERGPELPGPLDVGNVLLVGVGGVGSCLAYWLREFGIIGSWHVLDGDDAILHNLNRCLGLLARDVGLLGGLARNKAVAAAELFGASPHPLWYDQFDHESFKPDLILPLANERAVRHSVACRGEPVVMHATTSRAWEAQLHRHLPGRDDCISCRMPDSISQVQLSCATVSLPSAGGSSTDAALPFLSATAGVLLVSGLYRLQLGQFANDPHNFWAVCFRDVRRHCRPARWTCRDGCTTTLPARVRRRIHAGRRWSYLDDSAK
jgi:molybdopterin/thiamine biosynthesis adenylyltransferase